MFEYAGQMILGARPRASFAAALLLLVVVARAGAREHPLPHPSDETEVFTGGAAPGGVRLTCEVAGRIAEAAATVPPVPLAGLAPPPGAGDALAPSRFIQSASPAIARQARSVVGRATRLDEAVWLLYQHVAAFEPPGDAAGPQDAEGVLTARRGTSLGRARALVALLRVVGVPARLVGGLRLAHESEQRA